MPLPRVRFTVRRMMVAVAVVAVVLFFAIELPRMSRRARLYDLKARLNERNIVLYEHWRPDQPGFEVARARAGWCRNLAAKYRHAARHPFLPVAADPPEPE